MMEGVVLLSLFLVKSENYKWYDCFEQILCVSVPELEQLFWSQLKLESIS